VSLVGGGHRPIAPTKNPAEAGFFAVLVAQAAGLAAAFFFIECFLVAFLAGAADLASILAAGAAAAGAEAAWAKAPIENAEAIRTAMIFFMMVVPAGNLEFEPIAQVSQRKALQAG
jgi:hypothetical protein